jgi:hypothetical protein
MPWTDGSLVVFYDTTFLLFAKGFLAVARQPETIRVNDKILRVYNIVKIPAAR